MRPTHPSGFAFFVASFGHQWREIEMSSFSASRANASQFDMRKFQRIMILCFFIHPGQCCTCSPFAIMLTSRCQWTSDLISSGGEERNLVRHQENSCRIDALCPMVLANKEVFLQKQTHGMGFQVLLLLPLPHDYSCLHEKHCQTLPPVSSEIGTFGDVRMCL